MDMYKIICKNIDTDGTEVIIDQICLFYAKLWAILSDSFCGSRQNKTREKKHVQEKQFLAVLLHKSVQHKKNSVIKLYF